jgi:hypothetical protein
MIERRERRKAAREAFEKELYFSSYVFKDKDIQRINAAAVTIDRSDNGMGMTLPCYIDEGCLIFDIRDRSGNNMGMGKVVWSKKDKDDFYKTGIEFV